MDNAQSLIQAYNTGFYICITLSVLALISAIALFFLFDIRTNFLLRTNRAQQISVKQIKEKNAQTDPLGNPQAVDMDFITDEIGGNGTASSQSDETEALADQSQQQGGPANWKARPAVAHGFRFEITEDTVVIHTNEVIQSVLS